MTLVLLMAVVVALNVCGHVFLKMGMNQVGEIGSRSILDFGLAAAGNPLVLLGLAGCAAFALFAPPQGFPVPIVSAVVAGVTFAATVGVAIAAAVAPALRVRRIEISAALRAAS